MLDILKKMIISALLASLCIGGIVLGIVLIITFTWSFLIIAGVFSWIALYLIFYEEYEINEQIKKHKR